MIAQWIVWSILTFVWNAVNSINSRSKNSAHLGYNLISTAISSSFYMTALPLTIWNWPFSFTADVLRSAQWRDRNSPFAFWAVWNLPGPHVP